MVKQDSFAFGQPDSFPTEDPFDKQDSFANEDAFANQDSFGSSDPFQKQDSFGRQDSFPAPAVICQILPLESTPSSSLFFHFHPASQVEEQREAMTASSDLTGYVQYRALYDYEARNPDELAFSVGDIIMVHPGQVGRSPAARLLLLLFAEL